MARVIPRLRECNAAELSSLLEGALDGVARGRELYGQVGVDTEALRKAAHQLSSDLFMSVRFGYAAGVDLQTLREQMYESALVAADAGGRPGPAYMLRLFGVYEDFEVTPVANSAWLVTLADYFHTGERLWLNDVGYPRNDWQREECEYVDQLVEDPAHGPAVIANFLDAWVDERADATYLMAFEVAALAQMHGVDDSALAEHRRYPYELAHFLD